VQSAIGGPGISVDHRDAARHRSRCVFVCGIASADGGFGRGQNRLSGCFGRSSQEAITAVGVGRGGIARFGSASAALSTRPSACARSAGMSSVPLSGPKPGMAFGSLKSHWFSAMPMKSRMAGSFAQAWRSAARVNSAGTPDVKNPRMSVPSVIDYRWQTFKIETWFGFQVGLRSNVGINRRSGFSLAFAPRPA
jgi:hypothetical protein